ncbi:MAG TPA: arginine decarboxylase, pyruvoyl-dependent, partial [Flavisolibacter sp.]|nr:arginine decarboxylase, pyruvoyl-dependent [Flavisolibacter sp.]
FQALGGREKGVLHGTVFAGHTPMSIVPVQFFLTKGVGVHQKDMRAFENALRDAGIHTCNLIKTSSILPPGCQRISPEEGMKKISPGQITFAVMAQSQTNEPGQSITAGIGMAQPKDKTLHGYLAELEGIIGRTEEDVKKDVIEMAIENLATEWNPTFDGENVYRKGKKNYRLENRDVSVDSIVQSARGAGKNQYTIVITAAVFIYEIQHDARMRV